MIFGSCNRIDIYPEFTLKAVSFEGILFQKLNVEDRRYFESTLPESTSAVCFAMKMIPFDRIYFCFCEIRLKLKQSISNGA